MAGLELPQVYQWSYFSRQPAQIVNTWGNILCNSEINVGTPSSAWDSSLCIVSSRSSVQSGCDSIFRWYFRSWRKKFNGYYLIHFSLYSLGLEESIMGILRLCPPIGQKNLPKIFRAAQEFYVFLFASWNQRALRLISSIIRPCANSIWRSVLVAAEDDRWSSTCASCSVAIYRTIWPSSTPLLEEFRKLPFLKARKEGSSWALPYET